MRTGMEWALVADAGRARIFERRLPAGAWSERPDDAQEVRNPPSRARGTERPGRVHESASTTRHAIEPRTDPHRAAKAMFAQHLADMLERREGGFDRVRLVAPPAFLGDLRAALGEATRKKLAGTLDKDLTRAAVPEISDHLDAMQGD